MVHGCKAKDTRNRKKSSCQVIKFYMLTFVVFGDVNGGVYINKVTNAALQPRICLGNLFRVASRSPPNIISEREWRNSQ